MPWDHNTTKLVPDIFEENWQFTHHGRINRAVYYFLEERTFSDIQVRVFYSLQIKFKCLKHCISNFFKLFIVLIVKYLGNRVR